MCLTMHRLRMSLPHSLNPALTFMARPHFTRWLVFSALLATLSGCATAQQPVPPPQATAPPPRPEPVVPAPPAPVRVAPTRPVESRLWPLTRLHGADYIDVREIARRFGLKAVWTKSDVAMALEDKSGRRLLFEAKQRDFYFDGLRIFLGEPVLRNDDSLWITKIDVIKIVAPIIKPGEHAAMMPTTSPRLIMIDPGHGGNDPGKENKTLGVNETTFTLDVALRLKKLLEAQGWRVLLTRSDDHELSPAKKTDLQMRDDLANKNKVDLFLSIHFNSVEKDSERVTGVETYAMTPQFMFSSSEEKKGDMTDVAYPGNRLDYANLLLGEQLQRAMTAALKTPDRGLKHARHAVLRMLDSPGALVECAYLSSNKEAQRVATPEFRQQIAQALAMGLQNYATVLDSLHPKPVAPPVISPAPLPVK